MSEQFRDPLEELLNKHKDAAEGKPLIDDDDEVVDFNPAPSQFIPEETPAESEEDIYGDNDLANEIKAEEEQEAQEKAEAVQKAKEEREAFLASKQAVPASSIDMSFIDEATQFQSSKILEVNQMVQIVLDKHNIHEGYFPADKKMHVMGDLMTEFHYCEGLNPSEKFERIVIENWITPTQMMENQMASSVEEPEEEKTTEEEAPVEEVRNAPVVNITNHGDAPVTVNVDESLIPNISETRKVEINIVSLEEKEGTLQTVIDDANVDDFLIQPKECAVNSVPITLVHSGYRVVMRPMNWFDYLKMASPHTSNFTDALVERWTNIYNHILSTSIGNFESFDDFINKTKFEDQELFEWGLFVATSGDTEMISYNCNHQIGTEEVQEKDEKGLPVLDENGKPKMVTVPKLCNYNVKYEYEPASTIHVDKEYLPKYYEEVHNAVNGEDALKVHSRICSMRQQLTLPDSGYIFEISHPSAYDYITNKLVILQDLCKEFDVPFNENFERNMSRNPVGALYILCALSTNCILIKRNGNTARFTKWADIRKILDTLSNDDIQIIMQVFEKRMTKAAKFEFHNIKCPSCGDVVKVLPIGNLFELMGFNLSRRLQSTEINLIDIASN